MYHNFTDKKVFKWLGNSLYIQYMYIWKKVIPLQFIIKLHVLKINGSVYIALVIKTRTIVFDFLKELTEILKNNLIKFMSSVFLINYEKSFNLHLARQQQNVSV